MPERRDSATIGEGANVIESCGRNQTVALYFFVADRSAG